MGVGILRELLSDILHCAVIVTCAGLVVNIVFGWLLDSKLLGRRSTCAQAGWILLIAAYTTT